jgi:speckle-type POZ protein
MRVIAAVHYHMAGQLQPAVGHAGTSTSWHQLVSTTDSDTYGSSSTLSAETTTGSYVFTVADYSRDKELHAAGSALPSNTFTAGGYSWRITYSHDTDDWIRFSLCLEPPVAGGGAGTGGGRDLGDAAIMVRTRYILLDKAGLPLPSSIRKDSERALSTMRSMRATQFMRRKRFESYYLKDNRFSVRCDVTLVRRTMCGRETGAMPPPDMRRHLGELLAGGVGADVVLEVGAEAFRAHRSILAARSPVFKAELLGGPTDDKDAPPPTTSTTSRRLRIHDIEPSVFRAVLHFIYTDSLPPEIGAGDEMVMAQQLLVAAQRYKLEGLKWICEDVISTLCHRRAANESSCPCLLYQLHAYAKVGLLICELLRTWTYDAWPIVKRLLLLFFSSFTLFHGICLALLRARQG